MQEHAICCLYMCSGHRKLTSNGLAFTPMIDAHVRCKGHSCVGWLKSLTFFIFLLQDGAGALHLAACYGHAAMVQLLLQKQADPNVRTYRRHFALLMHPYYTFLSSV